MKTSNKLLSTALFIVCASILGLIQYSKFYVKDQIKIQSGNKIVRNTKLGSFTKLDISSNFDISIYKGPDSIQLDGDSSLIESLLLEIKDSTLTISLKENIQNYSSVGLVIKIYCNTLNDITLLGSGNIIMQDSFYCASSKLLLTGSGSIEGRFNSETLDASLLGSGEISNIGKSNQISATLSGSGDIDLTETLGQTGKANLLGSGNIDINCSNNLDIDLTGNGEINYKGSPKLNIKKLGNGEIHSKE
ncbi:MAG: DUF2807 domain-containing protein [Saprospiraceae bacterium]|nr:DUF2807 domain-containing protein [Candidatus Vicinibacter affinis]